MAFDDLPPKIIQHVFGLCCRRVTFTIDQIDYRRIRSRNTQATLSLVCSKWRAIALNTSTLWNDVMVCYSGVEKSAHIPPASFQFVQNWLNRAGMTPISLSISVEGAQKSHIATISQNLLSPFRITNLELENVKCDDLLLPTNNSNYLERLNFTLKNPFDDFPLLPAMPSLKVLRLCLDIDFLDHKNIYLIPWHQLRVLSLCDNTWPLDILLKILRRCKSLVECTALVGLQYQRPEDEHNIVLPSLESLVLVIDSRSIGDPIIQSPVLPNLRSLDIRSSSELFNPEAIIIVMTQRSGFNICLTSFSLCKTTLSVDVRWVLGSMPTLERVQLHGPLMFLPGTFDDLSSGTIGPRLEQIRFGEMSDEEITLMLDAVGWRHDKAKTLSDIRPFASVTCCAISKPKSLKQRAKIYSKVLNIDIAIISDWELPDSLSDPVKLDNDDYD